MYIRQCLILAEFKQINWISSKDLAATGYMVTNAALIMATVFGAFVFARVVLIQMLGLGLAVAVLVDATVIRVVTS